MDVNSELNGGGTSVAIHSLLPVASQWPYLFRAPIVRGPLKKNRVPNRERLREGNHKREVVGVIIEETLAFMWPSSAPHGVVRFLLHNPIA